MAPILTPNQISLALVARRRALGMSQSDVARKVGLSQPRYSQLESDPARLTVARLFSLIGVLGLEITLEERPISPTTMEW
jgi:HTH-type transcriptional regulator / antitoxin HipB